MEDIEPSLTQWLESCKQGVDTSKPGRRRGGGRLLWQVVSHVLASSPELSSHCLATHVLKPDMKTPKQKGAGQDGRDGLWEGEGTRGDFSNKTLHAGLMRPLFTPTLTCVESMRAGSSD